MMCKGNNKIGKNTKPQKNNIKVSYCWDYCLYLQRELIYLKNIINHLKRKKMKKYVCDVCGYEYDPEVGDPENGIEPGTAFEDLPEDWVCPLCGVGKDEFSAV